jgi:hypothetical protein
MTEHSSRSRSSSFTSGFGSVHGENEFFSSLLDQGHEFLAERRVALDLWGARVGELLKAISQGRRIDLKIVGPRDCQSS